MRIRTQLNALLIFICLVFLCAVGFYVVASLPIKKMQAEREVFTEISSSLDEAVKTCSRSLILIFSISKPEMASLVQDIEDKFAKLKNVSYLPGVNAVAAGAFNVTVKLQDLVLGSVRDIQQAYNHIYTYSSDTVLVLNSFSPFQLYKHTYYKDAARDTLIFEYSKKLNVLSDKVFLVKETIAEQLVIIDKTMRSVKIFSLVLIGVIAFLFIGTALGISFLRTIRVSKIIGSLEKEVQKLHSGILDVRFFEGGKDELNSLGKMLNSFVNYLNDSLIQIQLSTASNRKSGLDILGVIEELELITVKTLGAVEAVRKSLERLGQSVNGVRQNSATIFTAISILNSSLEKHILSLEDAFTAVQKINAIITSLWNHSRDVGNNAETLVSLSASGKAPLPFL